MYFKSESHNVTFLCCASLALVFTAILIGELFALNPCKLCLYARWPHFAALIILIGYRMVFIELAKKVFIGLGSLAMISSASISIFHSGVELKIWEGPSSCANAPTIQGITADELLDQIVSTPIVRCDEIVWEFFSLSMANWNSILSLIMLCLWLRVLYRSIFIKNY